MILSNYKRNLTACILLLIFIISSAQLGSQQVQDDFSTPRETLKTFLINLNKANYNPDIASKALYAPGKDSSELAILAIQLKKYLDGKALYVNIDAIPDTPDWHDSITNKSQYILFDKYPDIYLEKIGTRWLFPQETVEKIPHMYSSLFVIPTTDIKSHLPEITKEYFLGMQIWKYAGILIFLLTAFIIYRLLISIFSTIIEKFTRKNKFKEIIARWIRPIVKPSSSLAVFILFGVFLPMLELPIGVNIVFNYAVRILIPYSIAVIAFRLTDLVAEILKKLAEKTQTTVDDNLIPLSRKVLKLIVIVFGGIFILQNLDINVTPLLAGVSIGGLAIALAAQDTVKNLFGSVTIYSDQPFEIGDWIVFGGQEGTVIDIGVRSTRVRTFYDSVISVPNGKLADMVIDNMGRRDYRRYSTKLRVTYDTPAETLQAYIDDLKKLIDEHEKTRKDYYQIWVNEFGENSIDIMLYIFFEVPDWTLELQARHEIILAAKKIAEKYNIRFAYPIWDYSHRLPEIKSNNLPEINSNNKV